MLGRLLDIREDFPVAASDDALIDLELADDDFQRRITLFGGDRTLATLYLGKAEGPRQVLARRAGEATAYAVAFSAFDAPVTIADWTDKGVLQIDQGEIAALQVDGLDLVAPGDLEHVAPGDLERVAPGDSETAWHLDGTAGTAGGAELNSAAAARLAGQVAGLRVEQVLSAAAEPGDGLDEPQLRLHVTRKNGKQIDYLLGRNAKTGIYTLMVSTWPELFRLSAYTAHQLTEAARRDVLLAKPAQHAAAAAAN
jgi:hypothetical protein